MRESTFKRYDKSLKLDVYSVKKYRFGKEKTRRLNNICMLQFLFFFFSLSLNFHSGLVILIPILSYINDIVCRLKRDISLFLVSVSIVIKIGKEMSLPGFRNVLFWLYFHEH